MKFDDVYIVDADVSETEFLRRTYINLARNSYTPKILEGTFGPVDTCMMQVAGCVAHVDTTYKYDRISYVTGTVMVTERQRYGRSYRDVQVPKEGQVEQRTTETGKTSADVIGCVLNMKSFAAVDNPDSYLFYMNYAIPDMERRTKRLADREYKNLTLSDEAYMRSTQTACAMVNSMAPLPDEYDNISFNPTYYVKQENCYMVPYYNATYTYDSKDYTAKGYACGEPRVWNTCPDGINNTPVDTVAEKATGLKTVKYLFPVLTWVMYAIAIVLSIVVGVGAFWTFLLSLGFYLIGLLAYMIAASRCNNYALDLQALWKTDMVSALNDLFQKLNMAPVTPEESQEFSSVNFISTHARKGFSDITAYAAIGFVIHVITFLATIIATAMILA